MFAIFRVLFSWEPQLLNSNSLSLGVFVHPRPVSAGWILNQETFVLFELVMTVEKVCSNIRRFGRNSITVKIIGTLLKFIFRSFLERIYRCQCRYAWSNTLNFRSFINTLLCSKPFILKILENWSA